MMEDPGLVTRRGGFFLSLIHPPEFAQKVADFSAKVGALMPAMVYSNKEIHTTVGSISTSVIPHFYFDGNREDHAHQLSVIERVAEETAKRVKAGVCKIGFITPCILLPNLIIAPGEANQSVFEVTTALTEFGTQMGLAMAPCKNGHVTVNRFTEAKSVGEISDILRLMEKEPPFGVSHPIGIAAGYTLRHESERNVTDLRETPGHFHGTKFFRFQ
ncbi:MAG: hypothetical protein Q7R69_00260 [bacterium]|nr:hypothetical protein [bacterium]